MQRTFYRITLGMLMIASTTFAQVPTSGLASYYPFNGNADDQSGHLINGTVNGATLATDRFGNPNSAYSFDGISNYISFAKLPLSVYDSLTISYWMRPNSLNQIGTGVNISFDNGTIGNGIGTGIGGANGKTGNKLYTILGGVEYLNGTYTFTNTSSWLHVVLTKDKSGIMREYVNGVSTVFYTNGNTMKKPTDFRIGAANGLRFFNGLLDDIRIYNRDITANEVVTLYNEGNTVTEISNYKNTDETSIKIYPNPASDHLMIENNKVSATSGHSVLVTDILGQTVFNSAINQNQFRIDLANWTKKSVYLIKILDGQNTLVETRKVLVQ